MTLCLVFVIFFVLSTSNGSNLCALRAAQLVGADQPVRVISYGTGIRVTVNGQVIGYIPKTCTEILSEMADPTPSTTTVSVRPTAQEQLQPTPQDPDQIYEAPRPAQDELHLVPQDPAQERGLVRQVSKQELVTKAEKPTTPSLQSTVSKERIALISGKQVFFFYF